MLIYRILFPSGKSYIGKTIKTLAHRRSEHYTNSKNPSYPWYNLKVYRALRKYYGKDIWLILEDGIENEETLSFREKYWINHFDSFRHGYNATLGGDGVCGRRHSEAFKKKMSIRLTRHNPWKGKYGPAHPRFGKKHSQEWKSRMSERMRKTNPMRGRSGPHHPFAGRPDIIKKMTLLNRARATLSSQDVLNIRANRDRRSGQELAKIYGVTPTTISHVLNRRTWRDI